MGHSRICRLQGVFPVDIWKHTRADVSSDVDCSVGVSAGRLLRGFGAKKIYSGALLRNIHTGNDLEDAEIDYFYRAWFRPDSLDGNKCIAIVRRNNDTVQHFSPGRNGGQLAASLYINHRDGLVALVSCQQSRAIFRNGEIVNSRARWDTSCHFPLRRIYFDNLARLIARYEDGGPVDGGLRPGRWTGSVAGFRRLHSMSAHGHVSGRAGGLGLSRGLHASHINGLWCWRGWRAVHAHLTTF